MNVGFTLMHEDNPVLQCNLYESVYNVLNEKLLPYNLRGNLSRVPVFEEIKSTSDYIRRTVIINGNYDAVIGWFAGRVMNPRRNNSKKICNALNVDQTGSADTTLKLAFACHAVSILDHFWVKMDEEDVCWKDVDLARNVLDERLSSIALQGKCLDVKDSTVITPELTTRGSFAKAWKRHSGGSLWLYKHGKDGSWESKVEVMVSKILDKINVNHVKYSAGEDEGEYICMCPCMTSDTLSVLHGVDFMIYCEVNKLDVLQELKKLDSDSLYKMWIVDYLICNPGRHGRNWGVYYDSATFDFVGMAPLFDHNRAFDSDVMYNPDSKYILTDETYRYSAKEAMKHVDFHFTESITCEDFLTDEMWESFSWRATDLGLM